MKQLIRNQNGKVRGYICDHGEKVYDTTYKYDCPECQSLSGAGEFTIPVKKKSRLDNDKSLSEILLNEKVGGDNRNASEE